MTETRFNNLDFLRAFALLAGVLLHALTLYLEPIDGSEPRPLAAILYIWICLLYTSPSPRDGLLSRMPSSA